MDKSDIFEKYDDVEFTVRVRTNGSNQFSTTFTLEQLYQSFKERLIKDLLVDVHNVPNFGLLKDKDKIDEGLGD